MSPGKAGSEASAARRAGAVDGLLTGIAAGLITGLAVGAIDALWSWEAASQFLPTSGGRVRLVLFAASIYGLVGALVGAAVAAVIASFARLTLLGDLVRFARRAHDEARDRDPRDAVAGLSLALAAVPCISGALALGYVLAHRDLAHRKHVGLVIGVAMAVALLCAAIGVGAAFLLARPIEHGLRSLAAGRFGRALSHPLAPVSAAVALLAITTAAAAAATWKTISLLDLRPFAAVVGAAILAVPACNAARLLRRATGRRPPLLRRCIAAGAALVVVTGAFVGGASEPVRKAGAAHTALAGPLTRGLRSIGDLDRDGYSRLLGGGDCNDWDARVHPGSAEIPDDGVDNNCVGGDARSKRSADEAAFTPVPDTVPDDFNVVLITIDTLRSDHLGSYGYERDTSPALDRLAADGAVFVNSWAHAPSTRYSIPAILTGRHPLQVRYFDIPGQWPGIDEANLTIAEVMKRHGFTTGAILNYWYFDALRRMNQGFDHYDNQNKRLHKRAGNEGPAKTRGSSSKEQTDKAIAYLDEHAGERVFLWVHYYDPHYDYERHDSVEDFGSRKRDLYDEEIRYTDDHIGRLIEHVKARGLYDRTVFVVTGDHGEGFGEHGIDLHGYHLYAAQTRVPLIVRVPGLPPGRVSTPAAHVDILPTLANLVGAAPSPEMLGRSLVDPLANADARATDRWIFQQLSFENNNEMRAAASRRCHVIYNVSPDTSWELYRIDEDPDEVRDVTGAAGPCDGARRVLEAWYDRSQIPEGAAEALLEQKPDLEAESPVDFGGKVRLLSVTAPARVRRGERFEVEYVWHARGRLPPGYKVFAHFEAPGGGRFIGDHEPARPFSWWKKGQYIRYRQATMVPKSAPPGEYTLWAGVFKKSKRLPGESGAIRVVDDRAAVATLTVAP